MATLTSQEITNRINAGEIVLLNCNNTLVLINEVGDIPSVLADCGYKEASLSEFTINGAPTNGQSLVYNSTTNRLDWTTPAGGGTWGSITGTLSSQTDLNTALGLKALAATTITAGTGLSGGGDLSTNRTLSLANTAVSAGSYTAANITVDAQGRITSAANGSAGGSSSGSGSELQYRSGAGTFGAITGSSVSGANVNFGGNLAVGLGATTAPTII